jgi:hypothetical protein
MAYNYLGLTNRVLAAFNEVRLTSSNFSSATGFHEDVKSSVNQAVRDVYQEQDGRWDFARTEGTQVLTVPTNSTYPRYVTYDLPSDAGVVEWGSFYIKRTELAPTADFSQQSSLTYMGYDQWVDELRDKDASLDVGQFGRPDTVVRLLNNDWTISTIPDKAYTVGFVYFKKPVDLSDHTDVPLIPYDFEQQIVDKGLYYSYMFRDNYEQAGLAEDRYKKGVLRMRRQLILQEPFMRFSE